MKLLKVSLLFILFLCALFCIDEMSYTPLNEEDINTLFPDYKGKMNCCYKKDYIGWSRGDIFDFSVYILEDAKISPAYPLWEKQLGEVFIQGECIFCTKWQQCPIDSTTYSLYDLAMNEVILNSTYTYGKSFELDLLNENSYYSVACINPLEKYFLLYNSALKRLYYIRQKGL